MNVCRLPISIFCCMQQNNVQTYLWFANLSQDRKEFYRASFTVMWVCYQVLQIQFVKLCFVLTTLKRYLLMVILPKATFGQEADVYRSTCLLGQLKEV